MSYRQDWNEGGEDDWDDAIDFGDVSDNNSVASEDVNFWSNKDSIICLIDASKSMFTLDEDGQSGFHKVIRAVIQTYRNKILTSGNDLIGVCFYGTKEKDNPSDLSNIMLFSDLDTPDADTIMRLEQLLAADFTERFGHAETEVPLGDALWTCSTIFGNCKVKVGTKRVFLFTNNDDPNQGNNALQSQAHQRAQDLRQLGIQIELFPLNPPLHKFVGNKFYYSIVESGDEGDLGQLDGTSKLEELLDRARSKEYKKRSQGRISFYISPEIEFGVRVYNLVQEVKKDSTVLLNSVDKKPIRTITKRFCEDTSSLLLDSQIKKAFEFGGTRVSLEKHEIRDIRILDTPSIRLIGFKPRAVLKEYHNIKHSSYIYPDETAVKGSSVAYAALLQKMLELDKIAICKMTARSNAMLRLVALLPCKELVKDGIQVYPSGLYIIYLPFADDVRVLKTEATPKANEMQISAAVNIVKKLRIQDFDCRNFDNPMLQHHYMTLEAIALDKSEQEIEIPTDTIEPDLEGMSKQAEAIAAFRSSVFPSDYIVPNPSITPGKKAPTKKRSRESMGDDADAPAAKKRKMASDVDWDELVDSGAITKCSLTQLKDYCRDNGIKGFSTMNKEKLIEEVTTDVARKRSSGAAVIGDPLSTPKKEK